MAHAILARLLCKQANAGIEILQKTFDDILAIWIDQATGIHRVGVAFDFPNARRGSLLPSLFFKLKDIGDAAATPDALGIICFV